MPDQSGSGGCRTLGGQSATIPFSEITDRELWMLAAKAKLGNQFSRNTVDEYNPSLILSLEFLLLTWNGLACSWHGATKPNLRKK